MVSFQEILSRSGLLAGHARHMRLVASPLIIGVAELQPAFAPPLEAIGTLCGQTGK